MAEPGKDGNPSCIIEELENDDTVVDEKPAVDEKNEDAKPDSFERGPATLNAAQCEELLGESWDDLGPLNPPEGCSKVTDDGGVLKKVLVDGHGDPPKCHARCLGAQQSFALQKIESTF